MKRSLVIYSICGLNGRDNTQTYETALRLIFQQNAAEHIVVSACCALGRTRQVLEAQYRGKINFHWINDSLPLNVTVNHSAREMDKRFGPFNIFVFLAADVFMRHPTTAASSGNELGKLLDSMESGPYGLMYPIMYRDTGYQLWNWSPRFDVINQLPVGRAANGHCMAISRKMFEAYGNKLLPDVFANHTSESVHSFMTAALKLKLAVTGRCYFDNFVSLDGPSAGWLHKPLLFNESRDIRTIFELGKPFGFGYEECQPSLGMLHDPTKFDADGYATDEKLYPFIRDNLFLTTKFDYDMIRSELV